MRLVSLTQCWGCRTLVLLVITARTLVGATDPAGGALGAPFLNSAAQGAGKLWFGTATDIPGAEQQNPRYMAILNHTKIWGQLTPTNYMKWLFTEPQQDTFDYSGGDVVLDLAEAHNQSVRCHNLVWYEELPGWVSSDNWTNATLTAAMRVHIETLVSHWGSKCYSWDVVNEAVNDNGTFRSNVFYDTIGAEYVPLAFKFASDAARRSGASIKLFYNDYGIEFPGTKNTAVQALVTQLKARGIQIDGVGFESHFLVGETPSTQGQIQAMQSLSDLGIDIHQTEIDVRFTSLPPTASGLAQQASDYYSTVAACMAVEACRGMTVWDFDDEYSWIPATYPGEGAGDLYGAKLRRKPAYLASWQAIKGMNCTVCS